MPGQSYYEVLASAVADLTERGFDSIERVAFWSARIREAAASALMPEYELERMLRERMAEIYGRLVERGAIIKYNPGVERFTLEKVRPALRDELDRRIMAAANLIKLNRRAAIDKTLQRFQGWATSIPVGGSGAVEKGKTKQDIRKSLAQLPFEERRVLIDQGMKLTASLSEILAKDGKALAGVWHSHWRQAGYDYREDHKERDEQVYLLRDTWALERGLIKPGPAGYYDKITSTGEEPFCRCYMTWLYRLRDLPAELLTATGRAELAQARAGIAA